MAGGCKLRAELEGSNIAPICNSNVKSMQSKQTPRPFVPHACVACARRAVCVACPLLACPRLKTTHWQHGLGLQQLLPNQLLLHSHLLLLLLPLPLLTLPHRPLPQSQCAQRTPPAALPLLFRDAARSSSRGCAGRGGDQQQLAAVAAVQQQKQQQQQFCCSSVCAASGTSGSQTGYGRRRSRRRGVRRSSLLRCSQVPVFIALPASCAFAVAGGAYASASASALALSASDLALALVPSHTSCTTGTFFWQ